MEYNDIHCVAVVGMGYVGMPLAVEFAKSIDVVIGFDLNSAKIALYNKGIDPTMEVGNDSIKYSNVCFTDDASKLHDAQVIIVAVPTPVNDDHSPDLTPLESASTIVGTHMNKNTIVVYESTVYPGVTESACVPILERTSGMKCGIDFAVGYSPERINPGDKVHTLTNIKKIVSGMNDICTDVIQGLYDKIISAGTFRVSSIKTAEAIKVIENTQRDVNIAFMNEIAMICHSLGLNTTEVIQGMNTKWNALKFTPGLVGGHCIGVDPYYLAKLAESMKCDYALIQHSRKINESVGKYIVENCIKMMIKAGQTPKTAKVVILGLTFKENCPDTRNSKVVDIISALQSYSITPYASDPYVNESTIMDEYGIPSCNIDELNDADCIIVAVAHNQYKAMPIEKLMSLYGNTNRVLIDVKSIYNINTLLNSGIYSWQL